MRGCQYFTLFGSRRPKGKKRFARVARSLLAFVLVVAAIPVIFFAVKAPAMLSDPGQITAMYAKALLELDGYLQLKYGAFIVLVCLLPFVDQRVPVFILTESRIEYRGGLCRSIAWLDPDWALKAEDISRAVLKASPYLTKFRLSLEAGEATKVIIPDIWRIEGGSRTGSPVRATTVSGRIEGRRIHARNTEARGIG